MLVHTWPVLPESLSLTSKVVVLGVDTYTVSHWFRSIMLYQGAGSQAAPVKAGLELPGARNNGCLLTSHLLNSVWFVTKQRPSGCKFTFCLCLFTEEQSHPVRERWGSPGSAKGAGQSGEGGLKCSLCPALVKWHTLVWTSVPSPSPKQGTFFFAQRPRASLQPGADHRSGCILEGCLLSNSYKGTRVSGWWSCP